MDQGWGVSIYIYIYQVRGSWGGSRGGGGVAYIYIYMLPRQNPEVVNLDNCQNHWNTNATFERHVYCRLCETHIFQVQAVNVGKFN